MNCCWIILLLLFCGQNGNFLSGGSNNGNGTGSGCQNPGRPPIPPMPPCGGSEPEPCPCEDSRFDSRFEPRFEPRPFADGNGNGSTCGCEGEGN